jgi:hypothetical protein
MIARMRQQFSEMELSTRLGYLWLLSFFILVLAVASGILIPILREKAKEEAPAEKQEEDSSMRSRVIEHRLACLSTRFEGLPRV